MTDTTHGDGGLILGVDPGLSGAFGLYNPKSGMPAGVWDMPTKDYKGKKELDLAFMAYQIEAFALRIALAVIEDVHSMPNQGVASTFKFGVSKGVVMGMLAGFHIPIVLIRPEVWKPSLGLSRNKNESRALATKLFPSHGLHFSRHKDDGRAEAILLALFAARNLKNGK